LRGLRNQSNSSNAKEPKEKSFDADLQNFTPEPKSTYKDTTYIHTQKKQKEGNNISVYQSLNPKIKNCLVANLINLKLNPEKQ
jgi:hypothetical protein